MSKKTVIRIGVVLLAITLAALLGTALISMSEGVGGIPIGYSRTGRQSVFIGVTYLPVFFIAFVIGCIYLWHRLRKLWTARGQHRERVKES